MPKELKAALGRQAFIEDRSSGSIVRELIRAYVDLHDVKGAAKAVAAFTSKTALVTLFGIGFGAVIAQGLLPTSDHHIRAPRPTLRVQTAKKEQ